MGGIQSRFHTLLCEGDIAKAAQLWNENPELQIHFDPSLPARGSRWRDPPLHCLLRNGDYKNALLMELAHDLLRNGASPILVNKKKETAMHIVCTSQRNSKRVSMARKEVLQLLLEWLPREGEQSISDEGSKQLNDCSIWLEICDTSRNTPLHLAAASGLLDCVELLLANGAPLFMRNVAKQTPLDAAVVARQTVIANFLESKMVFSVDDSEVTASTGSEFKSFYTPDQLKDMQSDVVKSVISHLNIPEYAARALLSTYGWSEQLVYQAYDVERDAACKKAGIDPTQLQADVEKQSIEDFNIECEICYELISANERVDIPCGHHFCKECWTQYLEAEVTGGGGKEIRCPGHECRRPVPTEVIMKLVSTDLFRKYSDLNLQQFVDSQDNIKWCPYPDCGQAAQLQAHHQYKPVFGTAQGINVECGNGHGFCWHCLKHAHEPCECELWEKWLKEIPRMAKATNVNLSQLEDTAEADAEWIIQNTKPCPQCKSPIQKTEGCNHMTCRKCYCDFCWVCLGPWRSHSPRTGGYFTCNRYSAQRKANKSVEEARKSLAEQYRRSATEDIQRQGDKFKFYYTRYENHLLSIKLEQHVLQESRARARSLLNIGRTLDRKVAQVRGEKMTEDKCQPAKSADMLTFFEDSIRELLRSRRILVTSYAIGYLIPDDRKPEREAHETLQGKLEEIVEMLSQMINRPHLNTPRGELLETSRTVAHVCDEFLQVMRDVVLAGLRKEPPAPRPPRRRAEVRLEMDPLFVLLQLTARDDPDMRNFWEMMLAEERLTRGRHAQ